DELESFGVNVSRCPPDAHWQIGAVERRDAPWGWIWRRACDGCCAVHAPEEVDVATVAVSDAKNNAVRRAGRSANQCALGRTPRIPGELLSNDHGLAVAANATNAQHVVNNDYYRLEANIHTAQFNCEQQVRKSLLRKTIRLRCDLDKLAAGQQLRPAIGFERWVPDPEDIEGLESSCDFVRDGLWEDERGAGPQRGGLREEPDVVVGDGRDLPAPAARLAPPVPAGADLPGAGPPVGAAAGSADPAPAEPPIGVAPPLPEAPPDDANAECEPSLADAVEPVQPAQPMREDDNDGISSEEFEPDQEDKPTRPRTVEPSSHPRAEPPEDGRPRISTLYAHAPMTTFWADEIGSGSGGSDGALADFQGIGNLSSRPIVLGEIAAEERDRCQGNATTAEPRELEPLPGSDDEDDGAPQNRV
ncbi:unnamed protein product, partial [Prorocentrum cordatum]